MVANGQLELPNETADFLEFQVADFQFREIFILTKQLPNPSFHWHMLPTETKASF